jgi:hypothetical protein
VISFTYTEKTGVYMSIYYSTKIFQLHAPEYAEKNKIDNIWQEWRKLSGSREVEAGH